MNRYAKASAPVTWPGPRAGRTDDGGKSLPSPRLTPTMSAGMVRGPSALALPCVPPTGCRGKALLAIPKAMERPSITVPTSVVVSPVAITSQAHEDSIQLYGTPSYMPRSSSHTGKGTKEALMRAITPSSSTAVPTITGAASSSTSALASRTRKDLPIVHNYTRGNKRKALDAAADDDQMAQAMSTYIKDWRSAGDTSDDYWSTWTQLHRAHWDGVRREAADLLPLDPLRVHIIGALLKIGGYRSSSNYVDIARTKHIELGFTWGPDLDLARRRFLLSTRRGAGPPRQSEPLNFELVVALDLGCDPIVPGGPVNSRAVSVLSTFFLLREIEAAAAHINHLVFNVPELTFSWSLPVSKTDYTARGCSRTWGCICPQPESPTKICPYHTALEHVDLAKAWYKRERKKHSEFMESWWDGDEDSYDVEDMPLFPDAHGDVVTAEAMVTLWTNWLVGQANQS